MKFNEYVKCLSAGYSQWITTNERAKVEHSFMCIVCMDGYRLLAIDERTCIMLAAEYAGMEPVEFQLLNKKNRTLLKDGIRQLQDKTERSFVELTERAGDFFTDPKQSNLTRYFFLMTASNKCETGEDFVKAMSQIETVEDFKNWIYK